MARLETGDAHQSIVRQISKVEADRIEVDVPFVTSLDRELTPIIVRPAVQIESTQRVGVAVLETS